jgi:predicted kinase
MTSLVLLTGLPATGKSVVAGRLAEKYGFVILSTDDLRQSLFGKDYGETRKNGKVREELVRKILDCSKRQVILGGFDLVIDTCSPTDKFRKRMLEMPENLEREVDRYLLHIRAEDSIIYSRQEIDRGRTSEAIETIREYWQEPQNGFLGANLYEIDNNGSLNQLHERIDKFYEGLKKGL